VKTETVEEAQDIVLGMFLIDSHPAIVLFDTGASHSFIHKQFVTMQVMSPGGK
jgi:hypothetical protein